MAFLRSRPRHRASERGEAWALLALGVIALLMGVYMVLRAL